MPVRAADGRGERHARPPQPASGVLGRRDGPTGAGSGPRGPLDLVEHRVSGFLFDPALPGDLGSWVAVVEQLLAHYGAVAAGRLVAGSLRGTGG